jgi:hypothetical protein
MVEVMDRPEQDRIEIEVKENVAVLRFPGSYPCGGDEIRLPENWKNTRFPMDEAEL